MLNIKENNEMVSVQYDSILDVINTPCSSGSRINQGLYNSFYNDRDRTGWYGKYNSSAEIRNAALLGDKELYELSLKGKIKSLSSNGSVSSSEQNIKSIKRKIVYSSTGDELDIHKIYQGQSDTAWRKTKRIEVAKKFHLVTLLIDYVGIARENANDSLWRSAVAVKIYEELLLAGKSVRIVVGSVSENAMIGDSRFISTCISIKRYNEPLSVERLAVMSNLGFYRFAGFIAKTMQNINLSSGLGTSVSLAENNLPIQLKEEQELGHTKFVRIGRASNQGSANNELLNCYKQMEEFNK